MICQVTLDDCKNNCAGKCHFLTGQASPPPPTLAEIERLVESYGHATAMYNRYGIEPELKRMQITRAALMAAIRAYGRE